MLLLFAMFILEGKERPFVLLGNGLTQSLLVSLAKEETFRSAKEECSNCTCSTVELHRTMELETS